MGKSRVNIWKISAFGGFGGEVINMIEGTFKLGSTLYLDGKQIDLVHIKIGNCSGYMTSHFKSLNLKP